MNKIKKAIKRNGVRAIKQVLDFLKDKSEVSIKPLEKQHCIEGDYIEFKCHNTNSYKHIKVKCIMSFMGFIKTLYKKCYDIDTYIYLIISDDNFKYTYCNIYLDALYDCFSFIEIIDVGLTNMLLEAVKNVNNFIFEVDDLSWYVVAGDRVYSARYTDKEEASAIHRFILNQFNHEPNDVKHIKSSTESYNCTRKEDTDIDFIIKSMNLF